MNKKLSGLVLLLALMLWSLPAAAQLKFPIANGVLQTPLNANGQTITNLAGLTDTNGNPLLGGGGATALGGVVAGSNNAATFSASGTNVIISLATAILLSATGPTNGVSPGTVTNIFNSLFGPAFDAGTNGVATTNYVRLTVTANGNELTNYIIAYVAAHGSGTNSGITALQATNIFNSLIALATNPLVTLTYLTNYVAAHSGGGSGTNAGAYIYNLNGSGTNTVLQSLTWLNGQTWLADSNAVVYLDGHPGGLIPLMTSSNAPSGLVTAVGDSLFGAPYFAFSELDLGAYWEVANSNAASITYQFPAPVTVLSAQSEYNFNWGVTNSAILQCSSDGASWTNLWVCRAVTGVVLYSNTFPAVTAQYFKWSFPSNAALLSFAGQLYGLPTVVVSNVVALKVVAPAVGLNTNPDVRYALNVAGGVNVSDNYYINGVPITSLLGGLAVGGQSFYVSGAVGAAANFNGAYAPVGVDVAHNYYTGQAAAYTNTVTGWTLVQSGCYITNSGGQWISGDSLLVPTNVTAFLASASATTFGGFGTPWYFNGAALLGYYAAQTGITPTNQPLLSASAPTSGGGTNAVILNVVTNADNTLGVPHLGFVATGGHYNELVQGGPAAGGNYSIHQAKDRIPALMVAFQNFTTLEAGLGGNATVAAAIEYPVGSTNYTQLLFGGSPLGIITNGTYRWSDLTPLLAAIPDEDFFALRSYVTNVAGYPKTSVAKSQYNRWESGGTNKTMGGTIGGLSSGGYLPLAIVGWTAKRSILIVGDSRSYGFYDDVSDAQNATGPNRFIDRGYASANLSIPGEWLQSFPTYATNRLSLAQYATDIYLPLGINSVNTLGSALASNYTRVARLFTNKPVYAATLEPETYSSDGWLTVTGQTLVFGGNDVYRKGFNQSLRNGQLPGVRGYLDFAQIAESSLDSGYWMPGYVVSDGVHPSPLAFARYRDSIPDFFAAAKPCLPYTPQAMNLLAGNGGAMTNLLPANIAFGTSTNATTNSPLFLTLPINGTNYYVALRVAVPPPVTCNNLLVSNNPVGGVVGNCCWLGFKFTVGASPITVCSLSRYCYGGPPADSHTHTVSIFDASGVVVSASINMSGATAGTYVTASVSDTVLSAGTTYTLACDDTTDVGAASRALVSTNSAIGSIISVYATGTPAANYSFFTDTPGAAYGNINATFH